MDNFSQKPDQSQPDISNQTQPDPDSDGLNSSGPMGTDDTPGKKEGSGSKNIVLTIIALIVLGGVAWAGLSFFQDRAEDRLSNEEVLVKSVVQYLQAESLYATTDVNFSLGEMFQLEAVVDSSVQTAEDVSDMLLMLGLDVDAVFREGGLTMDFSTAGEMRVIDGVFYYYVSQMPEIPFLGDLSPLEGVWMHVDLEEDTYSGEFFPEFRGSGELMEFNEETVEMVERYGVEMLELAQDTGFITLTSVDSMDRIDGSDVYGFRLDIDLEELSGFLERVADRFARDEWADLLREAAQEAEEFKSDLREMVGSGGLVIPLTLAVESDTHQMKRASVDLSWTISDDDLMFFFGQDSIQADFSLVTNFHSIGEPVVVEKPGDSQPIEEVLEEVFGAMFDPALMDMDMDVDMDMDIDMGDFNDFEDFEDFDFDFDDLEFEEGL